VPCDHSPGTLTLADALVLDVDGMNGPAVVGSTEQMVVELTNTSASPLTVTPRFWVDDHYAFVGPDGQVHPDGGCDDWSAQTATLTPGQTVACTLTPLRLAYAGTESLWAELTVAGWAAAVWQQPDGFVFQVGNSEQLPTTTC
jgi:hypothetical protein